MKWTGETAEIVREREREREREERRGREYSLGYNEKS